MRTQGPVRSFLLMVIALTATACGPLIDLPGGGEPASLYALTPARNIVPPVTLPEATLMIEEPDTSAAFDVKGIALMPEDRELRYYAGAQWVDRAPKMVQDLLVTSFEESGAFRDVGPESMALAADYRLHTTLRSFNTDYRGGGAPVVRIAVMAKLFAFRPLDLAGAKLVSVEEPAGSDKIEDIIAAFDRANQRAMTELVEWTVTTVGTTTSGSGGDQTTAP